MVLDRGLWAPARLSSLLRSTVSGENTTNTALSNVESREASGFSTGFRRGSADIVWQTKGQSQVPPPKQSARHAARKARREARKAEKESVEEEASEEQQQQLSEDPREFQDQESEKDKPIGEDFLPVYDCLADQSDEGMQ